MARPKTYKPGFRRKAQYDGTFSPAREAWVSSTAGECLLFDMELAPEDDDFTSTALLLKCRNGRGSWGVNLKRLTVDELEKLRQFFNYAFDRARPFCEEADQKAQEEFERGITTHERNYRAAPQFVVLPREVRLNHPSIRKRFAGVASVGQPDSDNSGELRSTSDAMAESAPEDLGAQDDRSTPHDTEAVGAVGEVADGGTFRVSPTDPEPTIAASNPRGNSGNSFNAGVGKE